MFDGRIEVDTARVRRRCPRGRTATAALIGAACLLATAGCSSRVNVGVTGAAPAEIEHLWVTVEGLWFAEAADTPVESDAGWTRRSLSNGVVIDLAGIEPGTLVPLLSNLSLPAGTYRQLHLDVADADERLVAAARAVGLVYNCQVDVRDADGAITRAPLEMPVPGGGLTIPIELALRDSAQSDGTDDAEAVVSLALTLDASRDLVTYDIGSETGYILSPEVSVHDAASVGEIRGRIDASALALDHGPLIASAQALDDSGSHYVVVQRRRVAADGSFSLWPLPVTDDGPTSYDIVVSGADSETVIVREVPVTADLDATTLQPEPIVLAPASTVYANVDPLVTELPAGARVEFYQSQRGREAQPYLIDGTALDPVTRRLPGDAFALSAGQLAVGRYDEGNTIAFTRSAPSQEKGWYRPGSSGSYRTVTLAASEVELNDDRDRPTVVDVPSPQIVAGGRAGRLTVNVQVPAGRYDRGFLVVMAGHRVMESANIDRLLELGGGGVFVDDLPSGGQLAPAAGLSYRVALRAWNSRNPSDTLTRVAGTGSATLGDAGVGVLLLQVR